MNRVLNISHLRFRDAGPKDNASGFDGRMSFRLDGSAELRDVPYRITPDGYLALFFRSRSRRSGNNRSPRAAAPHASRNSRKGRQPTRRVEP